ncbi:VanZ family protein [Asticcacaulis sp. DXS10W]|uniref:VanZ family protein n=1 Tax=Asticcacaulis currens TaxID=2984210 RepID=A0ABT5I9D4_9CAUL|nr:VanZ family protein [Asticcacaulis currens]MDC7692791.1 VanZ family protein [Asticcacaulis currens]
MPRAEKAVLLVRSGLIALSLLVGVLVLGPFQGAEQAFGLNDKEAHVIAFFALTFMLQLAVPKIRRLDLALSVLLVGALIEIIQLFTGRSASVMDWLADAIGVAAATLPAYAETFRNYVRAAQRGRAIPRRRASDRQVLAVRGKASERRNEA